MGLSGLIALIGIISSLLFVLTSGKFLKMKTSGAFIASAPNQYGLFVSLCAATIGFTLLSVGRMTETLGTTSDFLVVAITFLSGFILSSLLPPPFAGAKL